MKSIQSEVISRSIPEKRPSQRGVPQKRPRSVLEADSPALFPSARSKLSSFASPTDHKSILKRLLPPTYESDVAEEESVYSSRAPQSKASLPFDFATHFSKQDHVRLHGLTEAIEGTYDEDEQELHGSDSDVDDDIYELLSPKTRKEPAKFVVAANPNKLRNAYNDPHIFLQSRLRNVLHRRIAPTPREHEALDLVHTMTGFQRQHPQSKQWKVASKAQQEHERDPLTDFIHNQPIAHKLASNEDFHNPVYDRYLQHMKMSHLTKRWLTASYRSNLVHDFAWPVPHYDQIPGHKLLHELRMKEFERDVTDRNRVGNTVDQRLAYLQDEVKTFVPMLHHNHLTWAEHFDILPQTRIIDHPFRTPPTVLREMVHNQLYLLEDNVLDCTDQQHVKHHHKDDLINAVLGTIDISNIQFHHLPKADMISPHDLRHPVPLTAEQERKVKMEVLECMLARHMEASIDAVVHLVDDFFHPFLEMLIEGVHKPPTDANEAIVSNAAAGASQSVVLEDIDMSSDSDLEIDDLGNVSRKRSRVEAEGIAQLQPQARKSKHRLSKGNREKLNINLNLPSEVPLAMLLQDPQAVPDRNAWDVDCMLNPQGWNDAAALEESFHQQQQQKLGRPHVTEEASALPSSSNTPQPNKQTAKSPGRGKKNQKEPSVKAETPPADPSVINYLLEHNKLSRDFLPGFTERMFNKTTLKNMMDFQDKHAVEELDACITWEHVLFAFQHHADNLIAEDKNSYEVHGDLPDLPLTSDVMDRIKYRLLGLFGHTNILGVSKEVPHVMNEKAETANSDFFGL